MSDWTPPSDRLPPEGVEVNTMDSGGHVQSLVYDRGMWWFPDRSMYVYYVPTFWQRLPAPAAVAADPADTTR